MKFCSNCSNPMEQIIPDDDNKLRDVCTSCGYIDYQNPKNIVGVIASFNEKILLCKSNTERRKNREERRAIHEERENKKDEKRTKKEEQNNKNGQTGENKEE